MDKQIDILSRAYDHISIFRNALPNRQLYNLHPRPEPTVPSQTVHHVAPGRAGPAVNGPADRQNGNGPAQVLSGPSVYWRPEVLGPDVCTTA